MSKKEALDSLIDRMLGIAQAIRAMNPARPDLLKNYWIDSYNFPGPAMRLAELTEEILGLNPKMLDSSAIQWPLVSHILGAVLDDEIDKVEFRSKGADILERLIRYEGTEELQIQLANLGVRSPFTFGNVEIHPIPNTGDTTEYKLKYEGPFGYGGPVDAVISFAVVPHAPGLGFKSSRNALEMVEGVLNIIRAIGLPTLWGRQWREAGVAGRGFGSSWVIMRHRYRAPWDSALLNHPTLAFMELEELMSNYSLAEVREVERIYVSDRQTAMEIKVLQALSWLGEATFPADNASKFAKLSIAFETAVGGAPSRDDQLREIGITQMLAERTAFLLGSGRVERLDWHRAVTKLYGSRSKVMHGETDPITDDELAKWAYLVWIAVRALLNRVTQFKTVDDLETWVRSQRYSLPSDGG